MTDQFQPSANDGRPDALARNFSAQLKGAFNLSGDLPDLSSHVEEHKHHILTQRQELHRLEAQLEETDEALAHAGVTPAQSATLPARDTGASGLAGVAVGQTYGNTGGYGGQSRPATQQQFGLGSFDGTNDAAQVNTSQQPQQSHGQQNFGQHNYGANTQQQSYQSYESNNGTGTYGQQHQQQQQQQNYGGPGAGTERTTSQGTQHSSAQQQESENSVAMSEQLLQQHQGGPVEPKATGYQQPMFSQPIKGQSQPQGYSRGQHQHQDLSGHGVGSASQGNTSLPESGVSGPGYAAVQQGGQAGFGGDGASYRDGASYTSGQQGNPTATVGGSATQTATGYTGSYHIPPGSVEVPYKGTGF